jgi:streptomycin 6-kinase
MHGLSATSSTDVLLHGDFTDKNLLLDSNVYIVIDPIPMVGDPCSDVGFFAAYHPPASSALDCAAAIASALGYDELRAARWAAVWIVHQTCETWRTDSDELHALASGPHMARLLQM